MQASSTQVNAFANPFHKKTPHTKMEYVDYNKGCNTEELSRKTRAEAPRLNGESDTVMVQKIAGFEPQAVSVSDLKTLFRIREG